MQLSVSDIVKATGAKVSRSGSVSEFSGVSTDSRAIAAGSVFVALQGEKFDAHDFVSQAASAGASAVLIK